MPWLSITVWLVTFLLQKSAGASNGSAALAATGAGLASYYLVDPANQNNVFGVTFGDTKGVPGSPNVTNGTNAAVDGLTSIGKTVVSESGKVLTSWGPQGTVGVIAGTAAVSKTDWKKWGPIFAGAAVLIFLRNRKGTT